VGCEHHGFESLFHEKFKEVNGSGAQQLVIGYRYCEFVKSPSKTPMSNLQFLTFFIIPLKQLMIMKRY
jgi:glutamine synthetase